MTYHQPPNGPPDGDTDDELSYEDFDDDFVWRDPDDDLDVIDLDALDEATAPEEDAEEPDARDAGTVAGPTHGVDPSGGRDAVTPVPRPHFARPPRLTPAPEHAPDTAPEEQVQTPEAAPETPAGTGAESAAQDVAPAETAPAPETGDQAAGPEAAPSAEEPAAAAPDAGPVAGSAGAEETPPEPAPPDWVYHVLIALPEELSVQVLELRATGDIIDMPPPGIGLVDSFRAEDLNAVQEQLARWARNHLPLQLEITGVLAEVVGQQQYVAAWLLQPEEELHEAQHDLRRVLAPLIQPLPEAPLAFQVQLTIGAQVPPRRYPHLVGRMQREFEPYVWHATDLLLVRKDAEDDDGGWEIVHRYD